MAKRFIDTNYFNDPFILSLKPEDKLLYIYFFTICDHAGIFELNESLGNFHLSTKNYTKRVLEFSKTYTDKVVQLDEKSFIIMCFCKRQYPAGVNTKVRQVQGVIYILQRWDIEILNNETFMLRVNNPYEGLRTLNKDYGIGNGIGNVNKKDTLIKCSKWRDDYEIYKSELRKIYNELKNDNEWIEKQEKFHPGVDIRLSIEKACVNYWATEVGWKKKKHSKTIEIDWKSTLTNAIDLNKVYKNKK
jgi:hypothetical protein